MGLPLEVEFADAPSECEGDEAGYGVSRLGGSDGGCVDGLEVTVVVEEVAYTGA